MKANVTFNHSSSCEICFVSQEIYKQCNDLGRGFAEITIPSYQTYEHNPRVVYANVDLTLPSNTIVLAAYLFNIPKLGLPIDYCYIEPYEMEIPVFRSIAISINCQLYDKLKLLKNQEEKLEFLRIKFGFQTLKTVISKGYSIARNICSVSCCDPPLNPGLVDFSKTQIVFVREQSLERLGNLDIYTGTNKFTSIVGKQTQIRLKSLKYPVPFEMIKPVPSLVDDDSIHAFATFNTLALLGVSSGSYVRIGNQFTSRVVRLFILLHPNTFDDFSIYVPPRIFAQFPNMEEINVESCDMDEGKLPVASSVSIARVESWDQSQKVLQNVILNSLKHFFTLKKRILYANDMIPIPFDSSMATLCTEDFKGDLPFSQHDKLVWFCIESFELEDNSDRYEIPEFIIDPNKTRLITANVVSRKPLTIGQCDFVSYYGLKPCFQYDHHIFPQAEKISAILNSFLKCSDKATPINTSILLHSPSSNTGKSTLVRYVALHLGFHLFKIDCTTLTAKVESMDSTTKIMGYLRGKLDSAAINAKPAIVYLSHLDILLGKGNQNHDSESTKVSKKMDFEIAQLIQTMSSGENQTVFVGSVSDIENVPQKVRNAIKFDIEIPIPSEEQRKAIFNWLLSPIQLNYHSSSTQMLFYLENGISVEKLAMQSAGLTPLDIEKIVQNSKYMCFERYAGKKGSENNLNKTLYISMLDLSSAISKTRDDFSASIGAPKIPKVTWKDIGGMDVVQGEIMDTIDMPLKHPELFASGMKKRSGILFYGPPGTGKTLMAKAIATNFSLNFFSVKGPELLNMYIGESEANVRRVFQKARDAKPCVIFFDELDSVAPKRGNQGDSGGVMDRIVSQLLAELDSMGADGDGVFVIGATNRPDLLDEALLRPGRFDKLLYLGISDTNEKQLNILKALTRKFDLNEDVDLLKLAKNCPFTYTGADFYALCSDAMLNAMSRIAQEVDVKVKTYNDYNELNVSIKYWFDRVAEEDDMKVTVAMSDFLKAQRELTPSVSEDELSHYLRVKANFEKS